MARLLAILLDRCTLFIAFWRRLLPTESFAWAALGAEPCPCPWVGCFLLHPRIFAHAAERDEVPRCSRRTCARSTSSSQSKSISWELNSCCHDRRLQRPLEFSNSMSACYGHSCTDMCTIYVSIWAMRCSTLSGSGNHKVSHAKRCHATTLSQGMSGRCPGLSHSSSMLQ